MRILLAGMVAGQPFQGGASWAVLQYFEGLRALGHEVLLVEPVDEAALLRAEVVAYFRSLPLPPDSAALLARGRPEACGVAYEDVAAFASRADVLLNISGMLRDERLLEEIPTRVFVDLDPGFNQVWHVQGEDMGFDLHTHFATVGGRVGSPSCPIPTCGRDWIATLPPVALSRWPLAPAAPRGAPFTSVGHWRSYGSLEHEGVHYGQRAHSLRGLLSLPRLVGERLELALGIHPREREDLDGLQRGGWKLLDPLLVAGSTSAYSAFVRGSGAELGVAKSGYVATQSGWFSDRSACYLASGRPVVAQRTGFEERLPVGDGLLAFDDGEEAAEAIARVVRDPERHRRAARALAEEHLDARKVLSRLLDRVQEGT